MRLNSLKQIDDYINTHSNFSPEEFLSVSECEKLMEYGFKPYVYYGYWPLFLVYMFPDKSFLLIYRNCTEHINLQYFDKVFSEDTYMFADWTSAERFKTFEELIDYLEN